MINDLPSHNELLLLLAQEPQSAEFWKEFAHRFHGHICGVAAREIKQQTGASNLEFMESIVQRVYGKLLQDSARALREYRGSAADSAYRYLEIITLRAVLTSLGRQAGFARQSFDRLALQTTGTAAKETTEL